MLTKQYPLILVCVVVLTANCQIVVDQLGQPFNLTYNPVDGFVYGSLAQGSRLFKIKEDGSHCQFFSEMYANSFAFANDKVYCLQSGGGDYEAGIIFTLNLDGGNFKQIRDFWINAYYEHYPSSLIAASDGNVYGTTIGNVFRINTSVDEYSIIYTQVASERFAYSPILPNTLMEASNGYLYGFMAGKREYMGTSYFYIYRLRKDGTGFEIAHELVRENLFSLPNEKPVELNGRLYGLARIQSQTTSDDYSILYSIALGGSDYREHFKFEKFTPFKLVAYNGILYGVGNEGLQILGAQVCQLFKIDPDGKGFAKLFEFSPDNSQNAITSLIATQKGVFGSGSWDYLSIRKRPGLLFSYIPDGSVNFVYDFENPPVVLGIDPVPEGTPYPNPADKSVTVGGLSSNDEMILCNNLGKTVIHLNG